MLCTTLLFAQNYCAQITKPRRVSIKPCFQTCVISATARISTPTTLSNFFLTLYFHLVCLVLLAIPFSYYHSLHPSVPRSTRLMKNYIQIGIVMKMRNAATTTKKETQADGRGERCTTLRPIFQPIRNAMIQYSNGSFNLLKRMKKNAGGFSSYKLNRTK